MKSSCTPTKRSPPTGPSATTPPAATPYTGRTSPCIPIFGGGAWPRPSIRLVKSCSSGTICGGWWPRLPGYNEYGGVITAQEYVDLVEAGRLTDPALNAHLKAGYQVKRVMLDFVIDTPSLHYCTWLEMPNADYKPKKRKIAAMPLRHPVRKIRVCAAQYRMRPVQDWTAFEQAVAFFVETADKYHCHFLLMPEFFTAQLFTTISH